MKGSAWAYPLANVTHLFGLVLLAGGIMAVDLRIAGAWRRLPLASLSAALTPFAIAGLALFAISGFAMFASDATALIGSPIFLIKLCVVALALANAIAFRRMSRGKLARWEGGAPATARLLAILSLILWAAAIVLGRMIAYR
jgi:uncharacterized membrane protein